MTPVTRWGWPRQQQVFAFAVAVGFQEGVFHATRINAMMAGFPRSAPDGIAVAEAPHAAAAIGRWVVVARDHAVAPRWDPVRHLLFAGDVRLHNRAELARQLELPRPLDELSDLDLAWFAYLAWGEKAPRHLIGDFAFVVWDDQRRTLFAARDPLGVRPLYYSSLPDGHAVASDIRQLLPLNGEPYRDVDPEELLARVTRSRHRPGSTLFRSISLLKPGHCLFVAEGRIREGRHWDPSPVPRAVSYQENCAELLRLFRRAVADRLDSDHPIVAHSSGGFDSSTILMACHEVYQNGPGRPPLVMASALTKGFPCDDHRYMNAISERVGFEQVEWDAVGGEPPSSLQAMLVCPAFHRGIGGGPARDLELAQERGARILLSGMYGDEVLFAGGIHLDMFRGGQWGELIRETALHRPLLGRGGWMLAESMLGALPRHLALRLRKRVNDREQTPEWLGPVLEQLSRSAPTRYAALPKSWPSHVSLNLWSQVTGNRVPPILDSVVRYGSEAGIEVRLPFADVRIVEHLLTMPWQQRLPRGHLRRVGRDALGRLLPPPFEDRRSQGPWTAVFVANAFRAAPFITSVLHDGTWHAAPFVERSKVLDLLRTAQAVRSPTPPNTWTSLLELVAIECWLRRLFWYNPPAR